MAAAALTDAIARRAVASEEEAVDLSFPLFPFPGRPWTRRCSSKGVVVGWAIGPGPALGQPAARGMREQPDVPDTSRTGFSGGALRLSRKDK